MQLSTHLGTLKTKIKQFFINYYHRNNFFTDRNHQECLIDSHYNVFLRSVQVHVQLFRDINESEKRDKNTCVKRIASQNADERADSSSSSNFVCG